MRGVPTWRPSVASVFPMAVLAVGEELAEVDAVLADVEVSVDAVHLCVHDAMAV